MPFSYPSYGSCLANLGCSVLSHFGIEPPNTTYPPMDRLLAKNYKNVVVMLFDGMGTNIIEKHLSPEGLFRRSTVCSLSSVFPPTTVPATVAIRSGLYPNQSAWLGWSAYIKEFDRNAEYFSGEDHDDHSLPAVNIREAIPYSDITDLIREAGYESHFLSEFDKGRPEYKSLANICNEVSRLCAAGGKKYIYTYYKHPDKDMHELGIDCEEISFLLRGIESMVSDMADTLSDTLLIITADHGHINIDGRILTDYPDICECLVRMPSFEARAVNFFVRSDRIAVFPEIFNRHFGDSFRLMTRQQVIDSGLFGPGRSHPRFGELLGDWLAVGVSDKALVTYDKGQKGHHAGLTPDELTVPFIAIEKGR